MAGSACPLIVKMTDPFGVPPAGLETFAVKVTAWPSVAGFDDAANDVVVAAVAAGVGGVGGGAGAAEHAGTQGPLILRSAHRARL